MWNSLICFVDGGVKNTTVFWQLFKNTLGSHYAAFSIETYVVIITGQKFTNCNMTFLKALLK